MIWLAMVLLSCLVTAAALRLWKVADTKAWCIFAALMSLAAIYCWSGVVRDWERIRMRSTEPKYFKE